MMRSKSRSQILTGRGSTLSGGAANFFRRSAAAMSSSSAASRIAFRTGSRRMASASTPTIAARDSMRSRERFSPTVIKLCAVPTLTPATSANQRLVGWMPRVRASSTISRVCSPRSTIERSDRQLSSLNAFNNQSSRSPVSTRTGKGRPAARAARTLRRPATTVRRPSVSWPTSTGTNTPCRRTDLANSSLALLVADCPTRTVSGETVLNSALSRGFIC